MSFLVEANVGPIIYKGTIFDSQRLGSSIIPTLRPFFLKKDYSYEFKDKEAYANIAHEIMSDPVNLNFLTMVVFHHYKEGETQLIITQRVAESKMVQRYLEQAGVKPEEIGLVLGETKPKDRETVIGEAKAGKVKILISSLIFDKGRKVIKINIQNKQ